MKVGEVYVPKDYGDSTLLYIQYKNPLDFKNLLFFVVYIHLSYLLFKRQLRLPQ